MGDDVPGLADVDTEIYGQGVSVRNIHQQLVRQTNLSINYTPTLHAIHRDMNNNVVETSAFVCTIFNGYAHGRGFIRATAAARSAGQPVYHHLLFRIYTNQTPDSPLPSQNLQIRSFIAMPDNLALFKVDVLLQLRLFLHNLLLHISLLTQALPSRRNVPLRSND